MIRIVSFIILIGQHVLYDHSLIKVANSSRSQYTMNSKEVTHKMDSYPAGGVRSEDASELMFARQSIVTHAKAYQLQAIDLVHIDFKGVKRLSLYRYGSLFMLQ